MVVTLNRPSRLNCFDKEVCDALSAVFSDLADRLRSHDERISGGDDAAEDPVVAVILTGAGGSFCAGADLTNPPDPLAQSSDALHSLAKNPVHQMGRVTVPIIGAVQGHCVTGGFELALACDVLVGNSTTKFKDTHVKFGLAPCWGLSQRLQRRVGPGRASYVSFSADSVDGRTAHDWGLLDVFVEDDDDRTVMRRAVEVADAIGTNDATMVRRYKKAVVEGGRTDAASGMRRERELAFAHYWEATGRGVLEEAKEYIENDERPRSRL